MNTKINDKLNLKELINEFLSIQNCKDIHVIYYLLKKFNDKYKKVSSDKLIEKINIFLEEDYKHAKNSTKKLYVKFFTYFMDFLVEKGLLKPYNKKRDVYGSNLSNDKVNRKIDENIIYTVDKIIGLSNFKEKERFIWKFFRLNGCRSGEFQLIDWYKIRELVLENCDSKTPITFNAPTLKRGKERVMQLLPEMFDYLINNTDELSLNDRRIQYMFKTISKKVTLIYGKDTKITSHNLRHELINYLYYKQGLDVKRIQNITGHANPAVIQETYIERDLTKGAEDLIAFSQQFS